MKAHLLLLLLLLVNGAYAIEISNVAIDGITEHAARIYFETDVAANTIITWPSDGVNRTQQHNKETTVRQWYISGLAPNTEYDICLQAAKGNDTSPCSMHTFKTLPESTQFADPEPPREYVDTSMPAMGGRTLNVSNENCNHPDDGLQAQIDKAQGGDTIVIPAGMVCTGTYVLPARPVSETGWIVIRTSTPDSQLPSSERVTPDDIPKMATLRSNSFGALRAGPNEWCPGSGSFMLNRYDSSVNDGMQVMYRCINSTSKEYELIPFRNGSSLPATCQAGEWFFNSTTGKMDGKSPLVNYAYQCVNDNEYVMMQPMQNGPAAAIRAEEGAHHYRLIGLELTRVPPAANEPHPSVLANDASRQLGVLQGNLVGINGHHIILDRVYVHGNGFPERVRVGIGLSAEHFALIDSRIDRIQIWKSNGMKGGEEDAVAISLGANGPGPALIHNNYIDTPGITIFADGGAVSPHDIIISNNHITASLNYFDGSPVADEYFHFSRHRFELKRGERFILRNNLIENSWSVVNQGALITLSPRPPFATHSWTYDYTVGIRDILFENNVLRNAPALISLPGGQGLTTTLPNPITTQRIKFDGNLIYNITGSVWQSPKQYLGGTGRSGIVIAAWGGVQDLIFTHNTVFNNTGDFARFMHYEGGNTRNSDLLVRDNLFVNPSTNYFFYGNGVFGTAVGANKKFLDNVWVEGEQPAWEFTDNVVLWGKQNNRLNLTDDLPGNHWEQEFDNIGFADISRVDFSLRQDSPYKNVASDGTDPGVDWDVIMTVLAQEDAPAPSTPPPADLPNDLNNDGKEDITDVVFLVGRIHAGSGGDINEDGKTNVLDVVLLVSELRQKGKL